MSCEHPGESEGCPFLRSGVCTAQQPIVVTTHGVDVLCAEIYAYLANLGLEQ